MDPFEEKAKNDARLEQVSFEKCMGVAEYISGKIKKVNSDLFKQINSNLKEENITTISGQQIPKKMESFFEILNNCAKKYHDDELNDDYLKKRQQISEALNKSSEFLHVENLSSTRYGRKGDREYDTVPGIKIYYDFEGNPRKKYNKNHYWI